MNGVEKQKIYNEHMRFLEKAIDSRLVPLNYRDKFASKTLSFDLDNELKSINKTVHDYLDRIKKYTDNYSKLTDIARYLVILAIRMSYRFENETDLRAVQLVEDFGAEILFKTLNKARDPRIIDLVRLVVAMDYIR